MARFKYPGCFNDFPHRIHIGNVWKKPETYPRIHVTSSIRKDMVFPYVLILCVRYVDSSVFPPEIHLSFNLISLRMELSI